MAIWTNPVNKTNGVIIADTDWNTIQENLRYLKGTGGVAVDLDTAALSILGDYKSQATSPAVWLDQTGTNAGGARWVLNSGALQLQRRAANYGSATTTPIIFIDMVNVAANTMRMGAAGVSINLAGASLSALDVNGGVAIGSYAGANAAPSNGLIVSGAAGFGYASPAAGSVSMNANLGVGTNTPQGRLDARTTVAAGLYWQTFNVTSGSDVAVLPAGTVGLGIYLIAQTTDASSGTTQYLLAGQPIEKSAVARTLWTDGGSNKLDMYINTDGSVILRRVGSAYTYKTTLLFTWR